MTWKGVENQTLTLLISTRKVQRGAEIIGQLLFQASGVIGTESEVGFLDSVGICDAFSVTCRLPTLKTDDAKKVLEQLNVFAEEDVSAAAEALNDMLLKKLHMLVEMAAQGEQGIAEGAIYSGREKI